MSVEQFSAHLTLEKQYSAHTVRAYTRDIEQFREFCSEQHHSTDIEDLPYAVIRTWIIAQMEAGITNRTINRKVASLRAYYKYLIRRGRIEASPLACHRPLKTDRRVEVPFSVEEMGRLLSEVPFESGYEGLRDRLIVELMYTTGIRRAELIGIRLEDLDLATGTLRVLGKRNKERIIPLLQGLYPLLKEYLQARKEGFPAGENAYLFLSGSGNKIYETLVYRIINKYLGVVSQKVKKSPHILRHTFATHMLNHGADMNSVKELLGHATLASTQVYTHNSIAELKRIHLDAHPRNRE